MGCGESRSDAVDAGDVRVRIKEAKTALKTRWLAAEAFFHNKKLFDDAGVDITKCVKHGKKEILPTPSANKTARRATVFYAVLGVLFCQIGSASASCETNFMCSTSGPNFDCGSAATLGSQQYCCCNNLGYMCSASSECYGGGSSGSSFGEFSVYIKRLRNAPDKDGIDLGWLDRLDIDKSDPCIQIDGPNGACGGTDTKWDSPNPDFYQRISCGCIDANGQRPQLFVYDNDDDPKSQCTAVRYVDKDKLGSVQLGISSRSDYDLTWDGNDMSLAIEKTFDTTKCQPPPPPPSPSPPPPPSPSPPVTGYNSGSSSPSPPPDACGKVQSECRKSTCAGMTVFTNTCYISGGLTISDCACSSSSSSSSAAEFGAVFGVLFGIGGLVAIVVTVVTYYCCCRKKTVSWVTLGSILIPTISY
jgi:hypothetical protein